MLQIPTTCNTQSYQNTYYIEQIEHGIDLIVINPIHGGD